MSVEKVTESIVNVGVNDYELTLFESQYELEQGMAYNSYLLLDEKTVLMDTVDASVTGKWLVNLAEALGERQLDYLVVQHMEPDHSGSIQALIEKYPSVTIVASMPAKNMMGQFFGGELPVEVQVVKEGDTLAIGSHTLQFVGAAMVHWPEVLMTYEQSEKVMFSADAFGKFGTRDADEDWTCEARRYYFNIVGKYGAQVQAVLKKLAGLSVDIICPLHGPVLSENLSFYIDKYQVWSSYEPEDAGVLIAYASIHGNTAKAAWKLKEMLEAKGAAKVAITDLCREDIHEAVEDAFRYDSLVLAASSYDAGLFPPMEHFLNILKAKNYQKRKIAIVENGSWAPSAGRVMRQMTESLKDVTLVEPMVTIKSVMNDENLAKMETLAEALVK